MKTVQRATVAFAAVLALSACGVNEPNVAGPLDAKGADTTALKTMDDWIAKYVPSEWEAEREVVYEDVIDDFEEDTNTDRTNVVLTAEGVTEEEFKEWTASLDPEDSEPACENASDEDKRDFGPDITRICYATGLYEGQTKDNKHFSVDAVWDEFGAKKPTVVEIYLEDSPNM